MKTASTRFAINLDNYEPEERGRIVSRLRSALAPEVQTGWNLFAHRMQLVEARKARTKPGIRDISSLRPEKGISTSSCPARIALRMRVR